MSTTLSELVAAYQTDPSSTYRKLRYHVRVRHDQMLARICDQHGALPLSDINARLILAQHQEWLGGEEGTKIAIAHAFVAQLRTLFSFGSTLLENSDCDRLSGVMHKLRFASPPPRTERLTVEQVIAVRKAAHELGLPSIALAQALQFECILRQKDIIGEIVPMDEPGIGLPHKHGKKWMRGLLWSEIDENLILRHVTSKKQKLIEVDLRNAPMVIEELSFLCHVDPGPKSGPIIICEYSGRPFIAGQFRSKWRLVADRAGIPKSIKNFDTRAGAITEATEAGADLEHVRHAATHSNISMTQRYSRGAAEKIAQVQQKRNAHRARHQ